MKIVSTQYTLKHRALELYLSGCSGNPKCRGCHNPELWSFDIGEEYDEIYFNKIKNKVIEFDNLIESIMIFGGEPNDQDHDELLHLLMNLKSLNKNIWLFTRYDFYELPKFEKEICDYIKCGSYIKELITDDNFQYEIKLATSNQKIYKKGIDYL